MCIHLHEGHAQDISSLTAPLDSSSDGEVVLLPCPQTKCPLCMALFLTHVRVKGRAKREKRELPDAHIVELREKTIVRKTLIPGRTREVSEIRLYLDGLPFDPSACVNHPGMTKNTPATFRGLRARREALALSEVLRVEQARLCAELAQTDGAQARFKALAAALRELEPPRG